MDGGRSARGFATSSASFGARQATAHSLKCPHHRGCGCTAELVTDTGIVMRKGRAA